MFQNSLEVEPLNFTKYPYRSTIFIHDSISLYILRRHVNTLMDIVFIFCLVPVSFPLFNNGWLTDVVNSTSSIHLKQHFKGITLIVVVCRCSFIRNISTEFNLLQGICKKSNCVTEDHYRITIKLINRIYALFDSWGHILHGLRILIEHHKTFG